MTDEPHWLEDLFDDALFYDRAGETITFQQWAELLGRPEYKVVTREKVRNWLVSTVWLGMNTRLTFDQSAPWIFETAVFGRRRYQRQWSWHTEIEALAGHDQICAAIRERTHPDRIEVTTR